MPEESVAEVDALGGWHGPPELAALLVPLVDLAPDPRNARKHPRANLLAIVASLRRFGQRKPIVTAEGVVVAGNGTLLAARELGWLALAAVDASDLTRDERRAYAMVDNRSAEMAEWDAHRAAEELAELDALGLGDFTGFSREDRETIARQMAEAEAGEHPRTVTFTHDQYITVMRAIDEVRRMEQDATIEPARALELLCADFMSAAPLTEEAERELDDAG